MLIKAILVWLALAVLAVSNGIVRNAVISPRLGDLGGHIFSTGVFCVIIFVVTWYTIGWIGPRTGRGALLVGVLWMGMTIAFEFLAGHYLFGNSWDKLLADYNIARGRVWLLVLVALLVAPRVTGKIRGLLSPPASRPAS